MHIVENRWDQGQVRQRLVASLGRLDQLQASGDLRQVIEGLVAQGRTSGLWDEVTRPPLSDLSGAPRNPQSVH